MNYKVEFEKAVLQTWELNLNLHGKPIPLMTDPIPKENVLLVLGECIPYLKQNGYFSSQELSGKCVAVHLLIKSILRQAFGLESHITIGSMHGNGWKYCAMSYSYIREELQSPSTTEELKAHIWLTLPDGSIVDWTGQAWYDLQTKETHELENCLVYLAPNEFNPEHYYRPYLVGEEFLVRTGTIDPVF